MWVHNFILTAITLWVCPPFSVKCSDFISICHCASHIAGWWGGGRDSEKKGVECWSEVAPVDKDSFICLGRRKRHPKMSRSQVQSLQKKGILWQGADPFIFVTYSLNIALQKTHLIINGPIFLIVMFSFMASQSYYTAPCTKFTSRAWFSPLIKCFNCQCQLPRR